MIHWIELVRALSKTTFFSEFIDSFIHPVKKLLIGSSEPRIGEYIKRILHLSEQAKTGDWYLYNNYTEIRVYGCELPPYKIPKYVPMIIFSLEYIRQMLNMDELILFQERGKPSLKLWPMLDHSSAIPEQLVLMQMHY